MKRTKVFFKLALLTLFLLPISASITAGFSQAKPEFAKEGIENLYGLPR